METYINTAISGAVFIWMLRIERHMAEIKTVCKLRRCMDEKAGTEDSEGA